MPSFPVPHGVIVPIVTPVHADGSLDERSAEKLVDHITGNGCGLLVLGTTGEVASLTAPLRRRFVEIAVHIAARRAPVFAGAVHNALPDSIAAANDYLALGADAVVGLLPNYFKVEPADMQRYFEQLANGIRGPLYLYNMPQTTGMSLPIEIIERLAEHENIAGLKDSENTAGRREEVARRLGGRADFALFMGIAAHAVAALRLGFAGLVPSSGNVRPAAWSDLEAAARRGDWATAERLQQELDALAAVFQRNRSLGQSLAALKAGLASRGLCEPHMVPPLQALPESEQQAVASELSRFPAS